MPWTPLRNRLRSDRGPECRFPRSRPSDAEDFSKEQPSRALKEPCRRSRRCR